MLNTKSIAQKKSQKTVKFFIGMPYFCTFALQKNAEKT